MTRLIIVTVLLAVVAVVVFWRGRTANPQRTVKVTARAGLARGSSVAVIEVDGRRFLIGAAGNAVNVLAELDTAPSTAVSSLADALTPAIAVPAAKLPEPATWVPFSAHHDDANDTADDAVIAARTAAVRGVTPRGAARPTTVTRAVAPAGSFSGPLERLKSMTVRTPTPARRALRSEL
jgi:hypothetical protein